jgi:hypothetical protein
MAAALVSSFRRLEDSVEEALDASHGEGAELKNEVDSSIVRALSRLQSSLDGLREDLPQLVGSTLAAPETGGGARQREQKPATAAAALGQQPRRYAVVGLAKGIDAELLYRFVRSLRQNTDRGAVDIVLFLDAADGPAGSPLAWVLDAFGVQVRAFEPARFPDKRQQSYHPSSYRWILIRDWMRSLPAGQAYDGVFFTDVRDTVFQGDPFAALAADLDAGGGEAMYAFLEAKPRTIAECGWNAGWVRDCFGEAGLREVGGNVISCSGTSLGTWRAALAYAELVGAEIATNACERNGVDQGMHNYFVYSGKLQAALQKQPGGGALKLVDNESGWVGTVQSMPSLTRDRIGRLLNAERQPYAVVHQYDRSQALKDQLGRQFPWSAEQETTVPK